MINIAKPEEVGIRSSDILNYIKKLEDSRLATHNIIIMKNNKIVYENYWKPFCKDDKHRMYSVTKSFVAIAIGFLEQDHLISLDDTMEKYFSKEMDGIDDKNLRNQTIRHMLMMCTSKSDGNWFKDKAKDRVAYYFQHERKDTRPSGTIFQYDSGGSFVLGALVERLTGMDLLDYLRAKCLDEIGFSKDSYCLKCPGGHSWGDSGLICSPRDLLFVAKFMMDKGKWNDKQLLNEEFATTAISDLIDTADLNDCECESLGYGYYIWRTYDNSFFFNGMGAQLAICVPDKDIVFIYNGDNQGKAYAKKVIIDNFFEMVVRRVVNTSLVDAREANNKLMEYSKSRSLLCVIGENDSKIVKEINNRTYILDKNPMEIYKIKLCFEKNKGTVYYTNKQGDKAINFGIGYNIITEFPQDGYSNEIGTIPGTRRYRCACSAAWVKTETLHIKVQIIDEYFGVLDIKLGFIGKQIGIFMTKVAEDFLDEYKGYAGGILE